MKRLSPKPPPEQYVLDDNAIAQIPLKLKAIPGFVEIWREYIEYRKENVPKSRSKPVPMTPRAAKMSLRGLERVAEPIRVIERSIEKGWEGLNSDIPFADAGIRIDISQNKAQVSL